MKRFFSLLLIITLILTICPNIGIADTARQSGDFFYKIKGNGTAAITGYNWANYHNGDIYIPRMLDGYTVTEIGEEAFTRLQYDENGVIKSTYHTTVESITIPDTVLYIGEKAFMGTRFEKSSITIPASVQYIGAGAFSNLAGIERFVVDEGNPVYATINGALYYKQRKELVAYPASPKLMSYDGTGYRWSISIPEGIISIGDYAMFGIGDVSNSYSLIYRLPSSLKHIGDYAFAHNPGFAMMVDSMSKSETLRLPDELETIGIGAFYDMGGAIREEVDLSNTKITEIPELAFYGLSVSGKIVFPEGLIRIGDKAFKNGFQSMILKRGSYQHISQDFPSSLQYIGNEAFAYFQFGDAFGLKYLTNLIAIGDSAFEGCSSTSTSLTLPDNLETIGTKAFLNCAKLKTITIPASVLEIGDNMCNRNSVYLDVTVGTYAALWASENGYMTNQAGQEDTSWLD